MPNTTKRPWWIVWVAVGICVLIWLAVVIKMNYQSAGPLATPSPIVLTPTAGASTTTPSLEHPTPTVSVSVEYPTPTASQTPTDSAPTAPDDPIYTAVAPTKTVTPTGTADPIYTAVVPTKTATPTVDPVYTASVPQPTLPAAISCKIGEADGVKNLAACKVSSGGKVLTPLEVLGICQASARHSMWQVRGQRYGTELPVDKVERYISICLNGAGLNYRISSPTVMGYPDLKVVTTGLPPLRYIVLKGGYGGSEETFLYDAVTGKVIDDDALKLKVIKWNTPEDAAG